MILDTMFFPQCGSQLNKVYEPTKKFFEPIKNLTSYERPIDCGL